MPISQLTFNQRHFLFHDQEFISSSNPFSTANAHETSFLGGWTSGAATVVAVGAIAYAIKRFATPSELDAKEPGPKFTNENLTASFIAAIPTITRELNLEVATATQTETFSQSSDKTVFWGLLDLGTNVAQIRIPVTYRYHIKLSDPWELKLAGPQVWVTAPKIHASLPPAIHTDQMERLSVRGWGRESAGKLMQQLEKQITPTLSEHADNPKQIDHVREACRLSVAEFVRLWLEREGQWRPDLLTSVVVRFTDEVELPPQTSAKFLQ